MNFENFLKVLESNKDSFLNDILDKISRGEKITDRENKFLTNYDSVTEDQIRDYALLTPFAVYNKILEIVGSGGKVICNLMDRNGKMDKIISKIYIDMESSKIELLLSDGVTIYLPDNMFFNLIYNFKRDEYSLESHDEYSEKITKEI